MRRGALRAPAHARSSAAEWKYRYKTREGHMEDGYPAMNQDVRVVSGDEGDDDCRRQLTPCPFSIRNATLARMNVMCLHATAQGGQASQVPHVVAPITVVETGAAEEREHQKKPSQ